MTDARQLMDKISAFRQRLEAMPRLAPDVAPRTPLPSMRNEKPVFLALEAKAETTARNQAVLESSLKQLKFEKPESETLPSQLTARARRLLKQLREMVGDLLTLADHPLMQGPPGSGETAVDPLVLLHREIAHAVEAGIRLGSKLPDQPSKQLKWCDGLEAVLESAGEKLSGLNAVLARRKEDAEMLDTLALLFGKLAEGAEMDGEEFVKLADRILEEDFDRPLRFPKIDPAATQSYLGGTPFPAPARYLAEHALATARVMSRLIRGESAWQIHRREPILAALLHDCGMMRMPLEILGCKAALSDEQKRAIEGHAKAGEEMIRQSLPRFSILAEMVAHHHERADGTGYPEGRMQSDLHPLTRLLAVADAYTAMCSERPWRVALDPRTALTDCLLLAERGGLDRLAAKQLLKLSFYPIGSIVELSDGSIAAVISNHPGEFELAKAARPVVEILLDSEGTIVPSRHRDLSEAENVSAVRTLPHTERCALLARSHPLRAAD